MEKNQLKKKLENLVSQIELNSKDAHFAKSLISDLLSVKGQLCHEATISHLKVDDVADSFDGETFTMYVMKDGTAVYHVKGGMDIIAKPNMASLNGTISSLVADSHKFEEMDEEERSAFETEMQATAYVLNVPLIAFSDVDFMFDTASSVVKFLKESYEEAMSSELQDETPVEDEQFKDSVMAAEKLNEELSDAPEGND